MYNYDYFTVEIYHRQHHNGYMVYFGIKSKFILLRKYFSEDYLNDKLLPNCLPE